MKIYSQTHLQTKVTSAYLRKCTVLLWLYFMGPCIIDRANESYNKVLLMPKNLKMTFTIKLKAEYGKFIATLDKYIETKHADFICG